MSADPLNEDEAVRQLQHDLRTPLTAIWGHVQLLQRRMRRSTTLSPAEREDLLANLAMMTMAIEAQRRTIDAIHLDTRE